MGDELQAWSEQGPEKTEMHKSREQLKLNFSSTRSTQHKAKKGVQLGSEKGLRMLSLPVTTCHCVSLSVSLSVSLCVTMCDKRPPTHHIPLALPRHAKEASGTMHLVPEP